MTAWASVAAVTTGLAVIIWRPPGRLLTGLRAVPRPDPAVRRRRVSWRLIAAAAVFVCVVVLARSVAHVFIGAAVLAAAVTGYQLWSIRRAQARREARRGFVRAALDALADALRAGLTPAAAVAQVDDSEEQLLAPVRAAITMGGDVPDALRQTAARPGAETLNAVASAWQIAERCGAPLAEVLDSLSENAGHERELQRQVAAGVGPARATAHLMAFLPVFGVVIGRGLGTDPIAIMTGTALGAACLFMGVCLACAGLWWVERISAGAQQT